MMYELLEKLQLIFKRNKGRIVFMVDESSAELNSMILQLKRIQDRKALLVLYQLQDYSLPLEMLYIFNEEDIFLFSTYLFTHDNIETEIANGLFYLLEYGEHVLDASKRAKCSIMLRDILLILSSFCPETLPTVFAVSCRILTSFINQVSNKLLESKNTYIRNYLMDMIEAPFVIKSQLVEFFINHLILLLCCNSNNITNEEAFSRQINEYVPHQLTPMKTFFQTIFTYLERKESFVQLMKLITNNTFNYKCLLIAVSTYNTTFPKDGPESLKKFIDRLLSKALNEGKHNILAITLLLVRQCCAQEIPHFMSYPNWIESLNLKNEQVVCFFYSVLQHILPQEPAIFLKIQATKRPMMPLKCQKYFLEYSTLAKTRLLELNETTEYIGLFNDFHILPYRRLSDVTKVLEHYERTNQIMKVVLEASVFRKQYYTNVFLSELLKPSEECTLIKAEFIRKLFKAGKIPSNLYVNWKATIKNDVH